MVAGLGHRSPEAFHGIASIVGPRGHLIVHGRNDACVSVLSPHLRPLGALTQVPLRGKQPHPLGAIYPRDIKEAYVPCPPEIRSVCGWAILRVREINISFPSYAIPPQQIAPSVRQAVSAKAFRPRPHGLGETSRTNLPLVRPPRPSPQSSTPTV